MEEMDSEYGTYVNFLPYDNVNMSEEMIRQDREYSPYALMAAAISISQYVAPLLLVLGTVGNIVSMVILISITKKFISSAAYFVILCIVDLLVLYIRCGNEWALVFLGKDVTHMIITSSEVWCQGYSFIMGVLLHLSRWSITGALAETVIVCTYQSKYKNIICHETVKNIMIVIFLIVVFSNAHYFWTFGLYPMDNSANAVKDCTFHSYGSIYNENFRRMILPIVELVLSCFLPILITVLFMVYLCSRKPHHDGRLWKWKEWKEFRKILFILSLMFIFVPTIETGYNVFEYLQSIVEFVPNTAQSYGRRTLARTICITITHAFMACKFFVYIGFWPKFRTIFRNFFRRKCCKSLIYNTADKEILIV